MRSDAFKFPKVMFMTEKLSVRHTNFDIQFKHNIINDTVEFPELLYQEP